MPAEEPRAIIPSATANRSADNRGRFSASAGAVCANSDANWGGLGAGGGGAGCRLTTIGSRAMSPRTKATAATIKAAVSLAVQRRQPEEQGREKRDHHDQEEDCGDEAERGWDRNAFSGSLRLLLRILLRQTDDVVSHSA